MLRFRSIKVSCLFLVAMITPSMKSLKGYAIRYKVCCYLICEVNTSKGSVRVKNYNTTPLPYA